MPARGICWCATTSRNSSKPAARSIRMPRRRSRLCWRPTSRRRRRLRPSCAMSRRRRRSRYTKPNRIRRSRLKCRPRRQSAATTVARRDPAESDAQWLDAVRGALLTHHAERPAAGGVKVLAAPAVIPAQWPAQRNAAPPAPAPAQVSAPATPAAPVAAPVVAPALPPATSVTAPPVPQADPDHPVPPAAIPNPDDEAAAKPDQHRSRIGRWIAKIPLMGNVIDNGWN